MSPQCQTVLDHLRAKGSISGVEAAAIHRIRHLPRRIKDLREAGHTIASVTKQDPVGQRYVRYVMGGQG